MTLWDQENVSALSALILTHVHRPPVAFSSKSRTGIDIGLNSPPFLFPFLVFLPTPLLYLLSPFLHWLFKFFSFSSSPYRSFFPPLSRGSYTLSPTGESGERCISTPNGSGRSPTTKQFVVHFELKKKTALLVIVQPQQNSPPLFLLGASCTHQVGTEAFDDGRC